MWRSENTAEGGEEGTSVVHRNTGKEEKHGSRAVVPAATVNPADRLPAAGGGCAAPRPIEKCPGLENVP